MYKLRPEAAGWEPIAGVPWRDMTDEEYEAVSAAYDVQFPDELGSLGRWFEHVYDAPEVPAESPGSFESFSQPSAGDPDRARRRPGGNY